LFTGIGVEAISEAISEGISEGWEDGKGASSRAAPTTHINVRFWRAIFILMQSLQWRIGCHRW
jgi:hypothetical protein